MDDQVQNEAATAHEGTTNVSLTLKVSFKEIPYEFESF